MLVTMTNKKLKLTIEILENIIGNGILAFGVIAFLEQTHLITGGCTGISLALHYALGWKTSYVTFVLNAFFWILGLLFLGKKMALSVLLSTVVYPLWMRLFEVMDFSYFNLSDNPILAVICGSVLMGSGIAIVIRSGGSTGGLDIPVLMLKKYIGLPVGIGIAMFDFGILIGQAFTPNVTFSLLAYGFVMTALYSIVIDKVLLLGNNKMEIKIMSRKKEELTKLILHDMDRGLTFLHSTTGFLREERDFILTVVDLRELQKFKNMIYECDPEAFIIITNVKEVRGRGFSIEKHYKEEVQE